MLLKRSRVHWQTWLLALGIGVPAFSTKAADFSLAQVLSAPFPAGLEAAPAGGRAAWVFNDHGARNLWVAEPGADGHLHGHVLTHYTGDDGIDLGEIAWAPDGRRVAFTRGGDLEGGAPPNATSNADGPAAQNVFVVELAGGAIRQLGRGHSAVISPKGDCAVFIAGGQIYTTRLEGASAPQQLVHDRGTDTGLVFSPDGNRLAFVSARSGRTMVGVIDLTTRRISWMAPSVDSDQAPEFSPDSAQIALVRVPAGQGAVDAVSHTTGEPWSIVVADPATGKGHEIWKALPGVGSAFHPALTERALMWGARDRIVFPWERTGWLHLYAVEASGGAAKEITGAGNYEVFNVALSQDRRHLAYSTNYGDVERWHLWEVGFDDSAPRRLTGGLGIEDYPIMTSDGIVVALHSDARTPVAPVQVDGNGLMQPLAPDALPKSFPTRDLVEPHTVVFSASDGLTIHGQLFVPRHPVAGRGPAILFFHGGPNRQMFPAFHPIDAYTFMYAFNQYLASEGYVVLSVNYRGGIGYGLDFREAKNFGAAGASETNDILGAAAYLNARQDVDPKHLGIWGGSYGGLMTALGLARGPDLFAAGVDYAGVHDWRLELPQLSGPAADLAFRSSALSTMDRWRAPVLVIHSDDDRDVPFAESVALIEALRSHGVPYQQLVLPDEVHNLLRAESWQTLFDASDKFLAHYLR